MSGTIGYEELRAATVRQVAQLIVLATLIGYGLIAYAID
jgi:hypothetical protein